MPGRTTIAILGGGQLGRMFLENALRYDVRIHVLDPDPACPCAGIAHQFVQGRFDDEATVLAFAADADVVGIEIEHVSVSAMEKLKAMGKRVIPDPDVLRTIQDKGLQKAFYRDHGLPTTEFALIGNAAAIADHHDLLPAFLKARTGGYDGRGVMSLDGPTHTAPGFTGPYVLERRSDIALELAVMVVRSLNGAMATYDPVEMVFDPRHHLVDHLRAPARIDAGAALQARQLAARVAEAFDAPGLYAVELFLERNGTLLVNETAPRAHNSGHHSIEACGSSQFDQLLRLYLDLPLGDTTLRTPAAMINLVGEGGSGVMHLEGMNDVLHLPGTFLHLYGKRETRDGRKMGHVTVTAKDHAGLDQGISLTKAHCRVIPEPSA